LLQRFVERTSIARVPWNHTEDRYALGQWASDQRTAYRRGQLSNERTIRLEALPGWAWHLYDASWEEGYAALTRFIASEGHSRVPRDYVDEGGYRLGDWVVGQRQRHGAGRLPAVRATRLSGLPSWAWNVREAQWEAAFAALEGFIARKKHARVPYKHIEDDFPLGQWVVAQRSEHANSRLAADRTGRLEDLPGWTWDANEADWEAGYAALAAFAADEGHTRVAKDYVTTDGYRLGSWAGIQRGRRNAGRLPAKRATRLERLPGWDWTPQDSAWESGYAALVGFVAAKGHARIPSKYVDADGYRLGQWVNTQRQFRERDRLSEARVARLEAVPGWLWDSLEARWEQGFAHLEQFVASNDHARVPANYVDDDGFKLGKWVVGG
jgi:hypothetical protein